MERIVVLGLGNILYGDEGFGVRVAERLYSRYAFPDNVEIVDAGTQGHPLLAFVERATRLLLLDEPTASLDNASKLKVRSLIEQLKAEGTTMLGIFHDLEFMEGLCDHEFNMQEGMMA